MSLVRNEWVCLKRNQKRRRVQQCEIEQKKEEGEEKEARNIQTYPY